MAGFLDKAKNFVVEKIADMEKPTAELTNLSIKSCSRSGVTFVSDVDVTNPYGADLPICEISYSLKSADRLIVSGTIPDPGSIKAKTETKVEVPLKVPYDFLISILRDIGRDWDIDYLLEVGLTIDLPIIGDFTIPLKNAGEIKLPTLSDIF